MKMKKIGSLAILATLLLTGCDINGEADNIFPHFPNGGDNNNTPDIPGGGDIPGNEGELSENIDKATLTDYIYKIHNVFTKEYDYYSDFTMENHLTNNVKTTKAEYDTNDKNLQDIYDTYLNNSLDYNITEIWDDKTYNWDKHISKNSSQKDRSFDRKLVHFYDETDGKYKMYNEYAKNHKNLTEFCYKDDVLFQYDKELDYLWENRPTDIISNSPYFTAVQIKNADVCSEVNPLFCYNLNVPYFQDTFDQTDIDNQFEYYFYTHFNSLDNFYKLIDKDSICKREMYLGKEKGEYVLKLRVSNKMPFDLNSYKIFKCNSYTELRFTDNHVTYTNSIFDFNYSGNFKGIEATIEQRLTDEYKYQFIADQSKKFYSSYDELKKDTYCYAPTDSVITINGVEFVGKVRESLPADYPTRLGLDNMKHIVFRPEHIKTFDEIKFGATNKQLAMFPIEILGNYCLVGYNEEYKNDYKIAFKEINLDNQTELTFPEDYSDFSYCMEYDINNPNIPNKVYEKYTTKTIPLQKGKQYTFYKY